MRLCVVCFERPRVGALFCEECGESYDRDAYKDVSVGAAIRWAASRARRFERHRRLKEQRERDRRDHLEKWGPP